MHPDVVAIWAKTKGQGCKCILETCLVFVGFFVFFFFWKIGFDRGQFA